MYRRSGDGLEVVVGEQRDRLTGEITLRLPKGGVEDGEAPERAAVREVAEETGVSARVVAPLGSAHYRYREADTRVSKRVLFFLMEHTAGEPHPRDGEMRAARWCPIGEAARALTFDVERAALERAHARLEREPA